MDIQATPDRLLLVEDDRSIRDALQTLLEQEGYTVDTAENGQVGLQHLRAGVLPRLILLDLSMPVMDGVQFRRAQLAEPALADIPVVVCSALSAEDARHLKPAAYIEKPVDIAALLSTIRSVAEA